MSSTRQGERKKMMYVGPTISLVVALVQIIQMIVNDPTVAFSEEIVSQMETPRLTGAQSSEDHSSYHSLFQSKRYAEPRRTYRHSFMMTSRNLADDHESPRLFRPTVWPHGESIDTPPTQTAKGDSKSNVINNGRYPGESTVLTDYRNDAIVDVGNFMEMDPQGEVKVPIEREENTAYVTCRFMDYQYAFFFPHFAQQIFRCWSFFLSNQDKSPVFVAGENEYNWKLAMDKEFNRGLLNAFKYAGIRVLKASDTTLAGSEDRQSVSGRSKGPILKPNGNHFQMGSIADMTSFRQNLTASLNITSMPASSCGHSSGFPRIGILTRRQARRIKNSKDMATSLEQHYNLTYQVPVVYFEAASLRSQVGMMGSIDILITPHGAQETGVAFMPRCGGVLELLPDKFFFPRFYGTLASTAGIQHAYIYLAENTSDETVDIKVRDIGFLHPSIEKVHEGVDLLLQRWQQCCNSLTTQES